MMQAKRNSILIPRKIEILLGILAAFLLLDHAGVRSGEPASMRRVEGVSIGDCKGCHGSQPVLPPQHVDTKEMGMPGCAECHKEGAADLRARIPLGHIHLLNGVLCKDCHDKPEEAKPLSTKDCVGCHDSSEKVAEATAHLDPNPHESPHYGTTLDCDLCHRQHGRSENFCAQCHEWELRVP